MSDPAARPPAALATGLALGLTALLAAMLSLFAWPAATAAPKDVPIVVAGPAQAVGPVSGALSQAMPGAPRPTTPRRTRASPSSSAAPELPSRPSGRPPRRR